ncbi:hypothetical protein H5A44_16725 [Pectobacterium brasiliense]|uniref:hypothetical protein n=1 Tax=Pectobacterium brasiliense TaxID=180957 RepID=UPI001969AFB1|nr:hypothetical protein [Pectobacterium brasiliense]MBN3344066.1 hypothetical protein [Pectobacterium brasiliense]
MRREPVPRRERVTGGPQAIMNAEGTAQRHNSRQKPVVKELRQLSAPCRACDEITEESSN